MLGTTNIKKEKCSVLKICRQCPLVLLIKVCYKQGKTLRIEAGRVPGVNLEGRVIT